MPSQPKQKSPLQFGIPDIDALLGEPETLLDECDIVHDATKIVGIEGPVGGGKSSLALHVAAHYQSTHPSTLVIFISSDWKLSEAQAAWRQFGFGCEPDQNLTPRYQGAKSHRQRVLTDAIPPRTHLKELSLAAKNGNLSLEAQIVRWHEGSDATNCSNVWFLDLSLSDAGDEWAFVKRLLTTLPIANKEAPPHLVVVDSLMGLETLTGGIDAFGGEAEVDSHVNDLIRILHHKAHLLYTCPHPDDDAAARREEAQADIIYRIEYSQFHAQRIRTIRVIKARGFWHPRDEHPFELRSPQTPTYSSDQVDVDTSRREYGYIQCFPSIQSLLAAIKKSDSKGKKHDTAPSQQRARNQGIRAGFGVEFLDTLASTGNTEPPHGQPSEPPPTPEQLKQITQNSLCGDRIGFPVGRLISLTGERETHKSMLGLAFARYQFSHFMRRMFSLLDPFLLLPGQQLTQQGGRPKEMWQLLRESLWGVFTAHRANAKVLNIPEPDILKTHLPEDQPPFFNHHLASKAEDVVDFLVAELEAKARQGDPEGTIKNELEAIAALRKNLDEELAMLGPGMSKKWALAAIIADLPEVRRLAIIITTRYLEFQDLVDDFATILMGRNYRQLNDFADALQKQPRESPIAFDIIRKKLTGAVQICLRWCLQRNLRFRRIVGHEVNPPIFFHIVRRNLEALIAITEGGTGTRLWLDQVQAPERIRLVIDDLRSVRESLPADDSYGDLASLLTTYLRNQAATALLIESTGDGPKGMVVSSPTGPPEERINVRAWRVPFQNGIRVALAIEPAQRDDVHGVVRELRVVSHDQEGRLGHPAEQRRPGRLLPLVDPDFELYTNLAGGQPAIVPLEVKLFAETPGWRDYIEEENHNIGQLFQTQSLDHTHHTATITAIPSQQYALLQQLSTLPYPVNLRLTVVLQVDEFWALRHGDLRCLKEYFQRTLTTGTRTEQAIEDQFACHPPTPRNPRPEKRCDSFELSADGQNGGGFEVEQKDSTLKADPQRHTRPNLDLQQAGIDRVPLTWDFGFMLADWGMVQRYGDHTLTDPQTGLDAALLSEDGQTILKLVDAKNHEDSQVIRRLTVSWVFESLSCRMPPTAPANPQCQPPSPPPLKVGWALFLSACRKIADLESKRTGRRVRPLALGGAVPDCLDAFIMEVWFSEIVLWLEGDEKNDFLGWISKSIKRPAACSMRDLTTFFATGEPGTGTKTVTEIFEAIRHDMDEAAKGDSSPSTMKTHILRLREQTTYVLPLYLTWLLLIEALDLSVTDGQAAPAGAATGETSNLSSGPAVACRHWYKTASHASQVFTATEGSCGDLRPIALPGTFSMRGDWHLGIAKGSRSIRLGELALDVLTNLQANRRRLDLGLGLPCRIIASTEGHEHPPGTGPLYETPTAIHIDHARGGGRLSLGALLELGARPGRTDRHWLWRSSLASYDHQSDTFKRWLRDICDWTRTYWFNNSKTWKEGGGFPGYTQLHTGHPKEVHHWNSFLEFAAKCDQLVAELRSITPRDRS